LDWPSSTRGSRGISQIWLEVKEKNHFNVPQTGALLGLFGVKTGDEIKSQDEKMHKNKWEPEWFKYLQLNWSSWEELKLDLLPKYFKNLD
jgi:hypothetical protein